MSGNDPLLPVGHETSGPSLTSLRGKEQAFDLRLKLTSPFVLPLNYVELKAQTLRRELPNDGHPQRAEG
jgi:hypothetical protein